MAFGNKKIYPIDLKPGTAIGVSIPFNAPGVFFSTYTTKDAIRNNLLNLFLTNKNERYLNNLFGANLRAFIFEQITNDNLDDLETNIQYMLEQYFNNIKINKITIDKLPDYNEINIQLYYSILNTGIEDDINIIFS